MFPRNAPGYIDLNLNISSLSIVSLDREEVGRYLSLIAVRGRIVGGGGGRRGGTSYYFMTSMFSWNRQSVDLVTPTKGKIHKAEFVAQFSEY